MSTETDNSSTNGFSKFKDCVFLSFSQSGMYLYDRIMLVDPKLTSDEQSPSVVPIMNKKICFGWKSLRYLQNWLEKENSELKDIILSWDVQVLKENTSEFKEQRLFFTNLSKEFIGAAFYCDKNLNSSIPTNGKKPKKTQDQVYAELSKESPWLKTINSLDDDADDEFVVSLSRNKNYETKKMKIMLETHSSVQFCAKPAKIIKKPINISISFDKNSKIKVKAEQKKQKRIEISLKEKQTVKLSTKLTKPIIVTLLSALKTKKDLAETMNVGMENLKRLEKKDEPVDPKTISEDRIEYAQSCLDEHKSDLIVVPLHGEKKKKLGAVMDTYLGFLNDAETAYPYFCVEFSFENLKTLKELIYRLPRANTGSFKRTFVFYSQSWTLKFDGIRINNLNVLSEKMSAFLEQERKKKLKENQDIRALKEEMEITKEKAKKLENEVKNLQNSVVVLMNLLKESKLIPNAQEPLEKIKNPA